MANFTVYQKNGKNIVKSFIVLEDAVTKLQTFVWIFNRVSRVLTSSLFNLRAPNLVKYPIST